MSFSKLLGSGNKAGITVKPSFDAQPALHHVFPGALEPGSSAPKSTTITGRLRVTLRKSEELVEIYTTITPRWFVRNKRYRDEGSLPSYSCRIQPPETQLPAGDHDFPFVFTLPCTAWPTSFLFHVYGRASDVMPDISASNIWYALEVVVHHRQVNGQMSKFRAEFPSRREALLLEGNINTCTDVHKESEFAIIASPVDPGEMPPPLQQVIEEYAPQIGPMNIILTARTLTPGSLITLNIRLLDVPLGTKLRRIRASVLQTFTWLSPNAGGKPKFVEGPFVFPFMLVEPPFRNDEQDGTGLSVVENARLPDDRYLAPTTLKNTITPNRISHQIVLDFVVINEEGYESHISMRAPVALACCTLIHEWLSVPEYGALPPLPQADFQPERPRDSYVCACGFSAQQLLKREEDGVMPIEKYEPPPIKERTE